MEKPIYIYDMAQCKKKKTNRELQAEFDYTLKFQQDSH